MYRWMAVGLIIALNSVSVAQAQSRGPMLWTISGAGAGFGIGLSAGLSAFDDAVNSDRKVWTSAIVGAGVGAVAGYLIGRARTGRNRPSTTAHVINRERQEAIDPRLLEQLAKSIRFDRDRVRSAPPLLGKGDPPIGNDAVNPSSGQQFETDVSPQDVPDAVVGEPQGVHGDEVVRLKITNWHRLIAKICRPS